jgi:hypothetical protein
MLLLCGLGVFLMIERTEGKTINDGNYISCGLTVSDAETQKEELEDLRAAAKGRKKLIEKLDNIFLKGKFQVRYIIDGVVIGVAPNSEYEVVFNNKATIEFGINKEDENDVIINQIKTANGKFKIKCSDGALIEYTTKELREEAKKIKRQGDKVIIGKANDDFIKLAEDTYKNNKKTEKKFQIIPVIIEIQPTYIINNIKVEFNENGKIDFGVAAKILLIDIGNEEKRIYKIETPNNKFKFKDANGKEYEYSISQEQEVEIEKDDIENKELFGKYKKK